MPAKYITAFADARMAFERSHLAPASAPRPTLRLDHLLRMTDDCGLIQHAKYATPNRFEGYCLDDNGRALLFTCRALNGKLANGPQRRELIRLSETYLACIFHAQNEDGTFRNFMDYTREFLEPRGSEDSYGRALWGLAQCVATPPRRDLGELANECFIRAIGHLDARTSPRTIAYGIIALATYLEARDDNNLRDLMDRSVNRLLSHYGDNKHDEWSWFEPYLSYDNAILPLALFASLRVIDREEVRSVAEMTTDFLTEQTTYGGIARPVGCREVWQRGARPQQFDQQPLEAMADVLLHLEAYAQSNRGLDAERAHRCYSWFHGNNDLGQPLYCADTAGCYDGLTEHGPNQNQGAESLLAYLVSRVAIEALPRVQSKERGSKDATLRKMLNGFAPAWVSRKPDGINTSRTASPLVSETAVRQYVAQPTTASYERASGRFPFLGK